MKRVLVTGGAGSIGSELVRQLARRYKCYILDQNETGVQDLIEEFRGTKAWVHGRVGDIRNYDTVEDVFFDFRPQIVYHAAAYKHVSPMELVPIEAIQTNIVGTHNVLHCAKKFEVRKFVFISTDKAVHSTSVMGATKRVGEIMVRNAGYTVVRFGNVLGSRGSLLPIWHRQLNSGRPITVTDPKMTRYFMSIEDAVALVIEAGEKAKGGQILVMDMGKQVCIGELAESIIKQLQYGPGIEIIGTRPGEQMDERLMTEEEEKRAIKTGKFWYI
jgi:FlaA1/EpsC-like NDP-sugar epimerase